MPVKEDNKCYKFIPYYKEDDVEALDGNRARCIKILLPHLGKLIEPRNRIIKPILETLLEKLIQLRDLLLKNKEANKPMIDRWCETIKEYEGWFPGSRSFRNNSPGNLKYANQYGTIGQDDKGFAIFQDYDSGYRALRSQLKLAASGGSKYYKPEMSLIEFFNVFAPAYENDPSAYALFVSSKLNVDPQTKIKNLL